MNKYYIYAHKRIDNNSIFYIGKGCDKRAYQKSNRNTYWKNIVNKHGYEVIFLLKNLNEKAAYKHEMKFIKHHKLLGECITNFTNGGDGVRVDKRWWNDKISKSLKGRKVGMGKESASYKDFSSKEKLMDLYTNKGKSTLQIADMFNVSYGTIWMRLKQFNIPVRRVGHQAVKIQCINDGLIFNTITSAAKHYNVYRENIRKVLHGKYTHTNKLKFTYL